MQRSEVEKITYLYIYIYSGLESSRFRGGFFVCLFGSGVEVEVEGGNNSYDSSQ